MAVVLSILVGGGSSALASHTIKGSSQQGLDTIIDYLYSDSEPRGDKRITYRLCDNLGYGVPAQWAQGVESWDSALGTSMEFDPATSCSSPLVSVSGDE
jgi:hypothetical protein